MKRILIFVLAMTVLLTACGTELNEEGTYRMASMEEAMKIMEKEKDYIILDVRTNGEYREEHIPGAICLPVQDIGEEPPAELKDFDQLILVYCRSGNRSKTAAQKLADLGYRNVVEFGGIIDWPGETESEKQ